MGGHHNGRVQHITCLRDDSLDDYRAQLAKLEPEGFRELRIHLPHELWTQDLATYAEDTRMLGLELLYRLPTRPVGCEY